MTSQAMKVAIDTAFSHDTYTSLMIPLAAAGEHLAIMSIGLYAPTVR